ncbi:MAG: succinate dehydrogenase/fumarate reductase iron-sulfur subunit [Candidatus Diapherotrites archaeon]|nr:succinate dehydrogenase/fumarate reductase iron-sulfur subunit [Candidatus Diapherotrites archaeon]
MKEIVLKIFRHDGKKEGKLVGYAVPCEKETRILDALIFVQEKIDQTLSFRWNCRAGTCGSCTVRVNGVPRLACKTPIDFEANEIVIEPLGTLKLVKDLLTDAATQEERLDKIGPWFKPKTSDSKFFEMFEEEVNDAQEMRKCIHCYACFDTCPVTRIKKNYIGPKAIVNINAFEMHPKDKSKRITDLEKEGLWNCIMSGCCSEVCPQEIKISEIAIPFAKEKSLSVRREKNE